MNKIENQYLKVTWNDQCEIDAIIFRSHHMLHDGKTVWPKIYPMIWPNGSFSRKFEVENKNYVLPKHGFWKELKWVSHVMTPQRALIRATHAPSERYPFLIRIEHELEIFEEALTIKTRFDNAGKETAYFQFGHHGAFRMDKNAKINCALDGLAIGLDGKLTDWVIDLNDTPVRDLQFGTKFDTIAIKNYHGEMLRLRNDKWDVMVNANHFGTMQIWKPAEAPFICLEPWQGYNDDEYDYPAAAKQKREIVALKPDAECEFVVQYKFRLHDL